MPAPDDPIPAYQLLSGVYGAADLICPDGCGRVYRARRMDSAAFECAVKC